MTDVNRPQEDRTFDGDTVAANRAREQGLGVGARELAAQRDPGGEHAADEDADSETGVSVNSGDEDALDQSVAVQGKDDNDSSRIDTPEG